MPERSDTQSTMDTFSQNGGRDRILEKAIRACRGKTFLYKYIRANDTGRTGAHQYGFHLPVTCWPLIFPTPGKKGEMKELFVRIVWNDQFETNSRFIWYGEHTRHEYRLTRFGSGFPYFSDQHIGSLLVLVRAGETEYYGFVVDADEDIDQFLAEFNISPASTGGIVQPAAVPPLVPEPDPLLRMFEEFLQSVPGEEFPPTHRIAAEARAICTRLDASRNPDHRILCWLDKEYSLFRSFEKVRYAGALEEGFESVDELVSFASMVLNRRKSRAGRSLEHHLGAMFTECRLPFSANGITEGNKRPDFIFPGIDEYRDAAYPDNRLVVLAAKTTCKDRWRQILPEADRAETKYLFTLQQGISANQLTEMKDYNVRLVVPKPYISTYPAEFRNSLLTLTDFIKQTGEVIRAADT